MLDSIPNYRSEDIDFANEFLPWGAWNGPYFDFIRCTRQRGHARSWPELCYKLFRHTNPGGSIEVYDVFPEVAAEPESDQPTWHLYPSWVQWIAQVNRGLEMPGPMLIKHHLAGAGFIRIEYKETSHRLLWDNQQDRHHIHGLEREVLLAARSAGMSSDIIISLAKTLRWEAQQFGLLFRRFVLSSASIPKTF